MNETNCTSIEWEYLKLFNIYTRPVLCVFAFFVNLLTLIVIYRFSKLRTIYNATITSLAVADMLVGFTGFICFVLLRSEASILAIDTASTKTYFAITFAQLHSICLYASFLHLVVLSLERFIAIYLPLRYTAIVNTTFIRLSLPSAWTGAAIFSIIYMMKRISQRNVKLFALLGMLGTFLLYLYILFSLFLIGIKTVMLVKEKRKVLPGQGNRSKNTNRINKATKRIALILLVFIITYTPGCFTNFVYLEVAKYNYFILHFVPLINNLILTNSCFNIVIYSGTSKQCRSAYIEQIQCLLQCIMKPYKRFLPSKHSDVHITPNQFSFSTTQF